MKKRFLFILFLFSISQFSFSRMVYTMNDFWWYSTSTILSVYNAEGANWQKINIPHTWNSTDGYIEKTYFRGTRWYKKNFTLKASNVNQSAYLAFEGILSEAEIYLNGKLIGSHKGGYTGFGFDVSGQVIFGAPNQLLVKVNNENVDIPPLHGDFTCWGGIYRDVKIILTDQLHIGFGEYGDKGLLISTPVVNEQKATSKVDICLENHSDITKKLIVKCFIKDKSGRAVTKKEQHVNLKARGKCHLVFDRLIVVNPELWSPDTPDLYTVEALVFDSKTKTLVDKVTTQIGFRWFSFDGEKGFFLNGKPLKLIGLSRHQDFEELGNALTDDFHRRDVRLIKDMGINFLRIAHYPQDEALLEECDKLGIICWEEIPLVDIVSFNDAFFQNSKKNLKEMIYQHYNHPSIVTWGFMNEIFLWVNKIIPADNRKKYYDYTVEIAKRLDSIAHKIDPSRTTTMALHIDDAYERSGLSKITDIIGWNVYKGWYGEKFSDFEIFIDQQHKAFPQRPLIISEYGAGSDRRLHTNKGESFDFSMEYQQDFHEAYLPYILERNYIAGSAVWNMNDFGSADRDESMPRINNKGLLFYNREPKDVFYYYKSMLRKDPVLHIATQDWYQRTAVSDNDTSLLAHHPVKIYSNMKQVELFVNGNSLGMKSLRNCNAIWQVPFREGKNTLIAKTVNSDLMIEDVATVDFQIMPANLKEFKGKMFEIGINCGSCSDFTDDKTRFTWLADKPYQKGGFGYVGGEVYRSKPWVIGMIDQIQGTRNVPLFQTMRLGVERYQFDVPDGNYEVELSFVEPSTQNQKLLSLDNVFDVILNGNVILPEWNIAANGGCLFALTKRFLTEVTSGSGIIIELKTIKGKSMISGIKIHKTE